MILRGIGGSRIYRNYVGNRTGFPRRVNSESEDIQMAGVKGRSGGARPGSGPKPRGPVKSPIGSGETDPAQFLTALMGDTETDVELRTQAAKALLPFKCARVGQKAPAGKKAALEAAAAVISEKASKFGPLRSVN